MKTVALTGNIGSGKSYVADILMKMGYPIYNADKEAAKLFSNPEIIMLLTDRFGMEILTHDGLPDRKRIATRVFNNPAALNWLNSLIHPRVIAGWKEWVKKQQSDLCFMESAIVFEHGLQTHFDAVLLVDAPEELAIQRVIVRDKVSMEQVLERLANQMPASEKRELTNYIIINDGENMLLPQIADTIERLSQESV